MSQIRSKPHNPWTVDGVLRKRAGVATQIPYLARLVDPAEVEMVRNLSRLVAEWVPDKTVFRALPDAEFDGFFTGSGCVVGVFAEARLVAYGLLSFPGAEGDNIGRLVGLAGEDLEAVAQLESSAVHPDYHGNGLQETIIRYRMDYAHHAGYRHAVGHVSPRNPVSLSNVLECGLFGKRLAERKPGYLRFICHREMMAPGTLVEGSRREFPLSNLAAQEGALTDGLWAHRFDKASGLVTYGRFR
jgi:GNAT superfamily N-acetyltransferase